ncbi:expressed unknown protein [Ectocarpus siliculosus]|uniref:Uncharacterized protein n=1 Tax=Ectocarpus siliculosus TaxID=2880 RepID=D8LLP3_ECTSI|nr:expressed unknown protein [Ectocarpus siliculosus]|eukprot:CBN74674.1 expressed unknown protein [Ectocarpus siliculosus]
MRVCSRRNKKDNCVLEARRRPREVTLSLSDEDLHDVIWGVKGAGGEGLHM